MPRGSQGRDLYSNATHRVRGLAHELPCPSAEVCIAGDPMPPDAPFNTYFGHGFGTYNGQSGYQCDWMFVDNGEPGVN
jgi:hypothetical protein